MKNFGNRFGYRNNNNNVISDARQILAAKRNNNANVNSVRQNTARNNNYNGNIKVQTSFDARMMIPDRTQNRPKLDFTIPKKTVHNELFSQDKPQNPNFSNRFQNTSRLSLSTNKFSGKNFSDPKASQGIFSSHLPNTIPVHKSDFVNRSGPNNSLKRANFKVVNDHLDVKRKRDPSVENMKFTVVNPKPETKKPALSTAKFAQKNSVINSLVSPIQGYRIEVKNLHPQVSVDDVYELFTSLGGELRSCNLVRPGYAEVVFRKLTDAEKSIEEFHGRDLDGKPMNLKLVTAALESATNDSSSGDIKSKIGRIQSNRKPTHTMQINKDAVFRSIYSKSSDASKLNKKPFKFSVTL